MGNCARQGASRQQRAFESCGQLCTLHRALDLAPVLQAASASMPCRASWGTLITVHKRVMGCICMPRSRIQADKHVTGSLFMMHDLWHACCRQAACSSTASSSRLGRTSCRWCLGAMSLRQVTSTCRPACCPARVCSACASWCRYTVQLTLHALLLPAASACMRALCVPKPALCNVAVCFGPSCSSTHVQHQPQTCFMDCVVVQAWTSQGTSTVISGPRGVGKTCLAKAALHNLTCQGMEVHSLPLGPAADVSPPAWVRSA